MRSDDRPPVLVTGASRGIGRAIANELGRSGHPIAVGYRSGYREANEAVREIVAAGESTVLAGFKKNHGRPERAQPGRRAVRRSVVDDDDLVNGAPRRPQSANSR